MAKITKRSNWGYWDELDNTVLKDGEKLRVTWPDETTEIITVKVIDSGSTMSDHGHPFYCADVKAFAVVTVHGVEGLVPLLGYEAERVK